MFFVQASCQQISGHESLEFLDVDAGCAKVVGLVVISAKLRYQDHTPELSDDMLAMRDYWATHENMLTMNNRLFVFTIHSRLCFTATYNLGSIDNMECKHVNTIRQ